MPQMAPMSWVSLYFMFISLLVIMIIMNYYMFLNMPKYYTFKNPKKKLIWKW